jgi:hypothetical protein
MFASKSRTVYRFAPHFLETRMRIQKGQKSGKGVLISSPGKEVPIAWKLSVIE